MKQTVNISIPKNWQELPDKELRYVFHLFNCKGNLDGAKAKCLLRWAKMHVVGKYGASYLMKYKGKVFTISAQQIAEVSQNMNWLCDFPQYPVRLSRIGRHRAVRADLQNVSFEDFLILDNLYQGFLQTQKTVLLKEIALILYKADSIKLSPAEETSIFYWFTSAKRYLAGIFTHFFTNASQDTNVGLTYVQLQANMNTQIRALTGGDITKEKDVLSMDCWRALTELDAKAKDYEELQKYYKS